MLTQLDRKRIEKHIEKLSQEKESIDIQIANLRRTLAHNPPPLAQMVNGKPKKRIQ